MDGSASPSHPGWERRFPGRQELEREALERHAADFIEEVTASGVWVLTFDWPLRDGTKVRLESSFPATYPYTRPFVRILGGLDPPPTRHVAPDGTICLLGRASEQWHAGMTLASILETQLDDALRGTQDEDPQGEPADAWWNALGAAGSFCLVDSGWNLREVEGGELTVLVNQKRMANGDHAVHALVAEVRDSAGRAVARWDSPMPPAFGQPHAEIIVPWRQLGSTQFPARDTAAQLRELVRAQIPKAGHPQRVFNGRYVLPFAFVHPVEVVHQTMGSGWIIGGEWGHKKAFRHANKGRPKEAPPQLRLLPVLRAGTEDLGVRAPAATLVRDKTVAVFGLGAIGAPVAIELARIGCRKLHLLDGDMVEPGNSVRWPLGTSAWGQRKTEALRTFVQREYPGTEVEIHTTTIGHLDDGNNLGFLLRILRSVDLAIDATVAWGVTQLLDDLCREVGVPLIQPFATPTLQGGGVARFAGEGGCRCCLEHAWDGGDIEGPPGALRDNELVQPVGCSERTFLGAGYDLGVISNQCVKLAMETLQTEAPGSLIQIVRFVDAEGNAAPPSWKEHALERHPACCSRRLSTTGTV